MHWEMQNARSSLRRRGPYGYIDTSQTMAYLSSCGYPPVLSSLASVVSKYQNRTSRPSSNTFSCPCWDCASSFLSFSLSLPSPMGKDNIFSSIKEMVVGTEKEERQLDGHGLKIVLHMFTYSTVCTSLSLCVLIFFFHCLLTLPSLLTLSPSSTSSPLSQFLLSLLLLQFLSLLLSPNSVFCTCDFSLCCFTFLVCFCLFPLDYVVRDPAVDYQSVDSQRAAKASSTNMRQYPNDWLVGFGLWKQASISAWARLGPQVCP